MEQKGNGEAGMRNEDAIKWLENLKQDIGQLRHEDLWPYAQAIDEIMELMEDQEAKTVELIQISRNFYVELTGYCPSCKRPLKSQFNKRFCGFCGQAVKWK